MAKILIHPATYASCREAVDRAFALFPVAVAGKKVLVKPNVLRSGAAEEGITTHPALLRAVVAKLETLGPAEIVVGDNPGIYSYGANEEAFEKTGLREAALGHYRNIGADAVSVPFDPAWAPAVSVSRAVLEADVVVSLPKFKTHGLTVMSGAVKNSYGILPGAQKAMLHKAAGSPPRFHELVVDVFRLRVPDLFIVDAVVGMEGNGPASTELRDIGLVLASDNAVALDAAIATMMGLDPARLRFLQKAKEAGLGDFALAAHEVVGELRPVPGFKLPPLGGEAITGNPRMLAALDARTTVRPQADSEKCSGCGYCVDTCTVAALRLVDGLPLVDADSCIACFCCQEMCPEKAMRLS